MRGKQEEPRRKRGQANEARVKREKGINGKRKRKSLRRTRENSEK